MKYKYLIMQAEEYGFIKKEDEDCLKFVDDYKNKIIISKTEENKINLIIQFSDDRVLKFTKEAIILAKTPLLERVDTINYLLDISEKKERFISECVDTIIYLMEIKENYYKDLTKSILSFYIENNICEYGFDIEGVLENLKGLDSEKLYDLIINLDNEKYMFLKRTFLSMSKEYFEKVLCSFLSQIRIFVEKYDNENSSF